MTSGFDNDAIDVLLPIRPKPPRLREVLQSLMAQDYDKWGLVVLLDRDNGQNMSTVLREIHNRRISFINCDYTRDGFPRMLNKGLMASNSQFIARQDDDDISSPNRLSSQLETLEDNPQAVMVTGYASVIDESKRLRSQITQPPRESELARLLIDVNVIPHSSVMFRRQVVLNIGGYDENVHGCEDYDLWLRLLTKGSIKTVGFQTTEILFHEAGMSRTSLTLKVICRVNKSRFRASDVLRVHRSQALWSSAVWSIKQLTSRKLRHFVNK